MQASAPPRLDMLTDYEYAVDLDGRSAAAHVVRMVDFGSRVLEVGAGSGSITRHLVHSRACEVIAVENNPASVLKLGQWCRKVCPLDLNDKNWSEDLQDEPKFDVVVAADVLEHLYDPWTVLSQMKGLLEPGGSIVLSLPHLAHCTVLAALVAEDFAYADWGLLDKTHLRFFGLHNIQAMHERAGLSIEDAAFVIRAPEKTELAARWAQTPPELQQALSQSRHANIYQVVTRAAAMDHAVKRLQLMQVAVEV